MMIGDPDRRIGAAQLRRVLYRMLAPPLLDIIMLLPMPIIPPTKLFCWISGCPPLSAMAPYMPLPPVKLFRSICGAPPLLLFPTWMLVPLLLNVESAMYGARVLRLAATSA